MSLPEKIRPAPWDQVAFGIDCFELADSSPELLEQALQTPGHYSVKVDPLAPKQALHRCGFYYCDTLLEPWCTPPRLARLERDGLAIDDAPALGTVLGICHGAFAHGRFHRDFGLDSRRADRRYDNWLRELHRERKVYGLLCQGDPAGFIARSGDCLVLHALGERYRGRGLARYFWSMLCARLFAEGLPEVRSSISAANLAALNLYAALGFRFRKPVDVYHRMVP
ncbi:MAG: GNAT family N-acetyltransferase [Betaproteobacteria bacterium]|nr:GNAT family N-acetyltransferase [Betaproteobacteria bacterium]